MATTYVPSTLDDNGFRRGLAAQQVGLYIDSFSEAYSDEIDEQLDHTGALAGFIHGFRQRKTISLAAEISNTGDSPSAGFFHSTTGAIFGAAFAFTASVEHGDEFGVAITSGKNWLASATIDQGRTEKKRVSAEFWAEEGFTGA